MSGEDHAQFFEALRRSSARLLRLNPDALSAAQSVRTDRCAALRLSLDRMASQQLAGEMIDVKGYISASSELERLLGGEPSAPSSPLASQEAQSRMRAPIEATVLGPDAAMRDERDERLLARTPMTEAEQIAHAFATRRRELLSQYNVLASEAPRLAYDALLGSFVAKQKLRDLDHELEAFMAEFRLVDLAFFEAAKRATQRDAHEVMRELKLVEADDDRR